MPKFVVTLPALPSVHFETEAENSLLAVCNALRLTVWTKEDFENGQARLKEFYAQSATEFIPSQSVDLFGNPT